MTIWTSAAMSAATGGRWLREPAAAAELFGASIDTRTIRAGEVFFALRGEHADGHRYLRDAEEAGAGAAVIDDPSAAAGRQLPCLLVADARRALADLARTRRSNLGARGCRVIGVTGSNGKTTTVRLVHAALSAAMPGYHAPKSFNNDLGLPLTLLAAPKDSRFVVCELGINAPGEMAGLVDIATPDVAVITSIGRAHLEALGSIEGVAREKAVILRGPGRSGVAGAFAVIPRLEPALDAIVRREAPAELLVTAADGIEPTADGLAFSVDGETYDIPLTGAHNAHNAALAVAVARRLGVAPAVIRRGLSAAQPPPMRLAREAVVLAAGGEPVVIVNDAYNANPDSMRTGIAALAMMTPGRGGRRVAVLGDMLELGEQGPDAHREVGETLAALGAVDLAVLVGPLMGFAAQSLSRSWPAERIAPCPALDDAGDSAAERIAAMIRPGDVVLIKGSRRMRLERVAEAIRARGGRNGAAAAETRPAAC